MQDKKKEQSDSKFMKLKLRIKEKINNMIKIKITLLMFQILN